MLFAILLTAFLQQPTDAAKPDVPVLKAGLGTCAADFTVKDADGKAVYLATIHARIRYGALNVKRMDIEVSTDDQGRARVEGLPNKAKPVVFEISKDDLKTTVEQDLAGNGCLATFQATIK